MYEGGLFQFANAPHYWLACLRTINGGFPGTAKVWRIYASTGGNLERQDCHPIQLVTTPVADRMEGAYRFD